MPWRSSMPSILWEWESCRCHPCSEAISTPMATESLIHSTSSGRKPTQSLKRDLRSRQTPFSRPLLRSRQTPLCRPPSAINNRPAIKTHIKAHTPTSLYACIMHLRCIALLAEQEASGRHMECACYVSGRHMECDCYVSGRHMECDCYVSGRHMECACYVANSIWKMPAILRGLACSQSSRMIYAISPTHIDRVRVGIGYGSHRLETL
jgi:hypothetical protein